MRVFYVHFHAHPIYAVGHIGGMPLRLLPVPRSGERASAESESGHRLGRRADIGRIGNQPSARAESSHRRERRKAIGWSEERPSAETESSHQKNQKPAIGRSKERMKKEAERERKRAAPQAVCCGTALCVNGEDARPRCLRGTGGARPAYRMGSMANV